MTMTTEEAEENEPQRLPSRRRAPDGPLPAESEDIGGATMEEKNHDGGLSEGGQDQEATEEATTLATATDATAVDAQEALTATAEEGPEKTAEGGPEEVEIENVTGEEEGRDEGSDDDYDNNNEAPPVVSSGSPCKDGGSGFEPERAPEPALEPTSPVARHDVSISSPAKSRGKGIFSSPQDTALTTTLTATESESPATDNVGDDFHGDGGCVLIDAIEDDVQIVGNDSMETDTGTDEGSFVAVELASPREVRPQSTDPSPTEKYDDDEVGEGEDPSSYVMAEAEAEAHNHAPVAPPVGSYAAFSAEAADASFDGSFAEAPQAYAANHPQRHGPRRKILRHPILTPLTKLPWDRLATAAASCDLMFNCRYSLKQVEDEVREEGRRRLPYGEGQEEVEEDGGEGNPTLKSGRDDDYVGVGMGNDCGTAEGFGLHGEEEGCPADDFAELGLDCCSMRDEDVGDADGGECVAGVAGVTGAGIHGEARGSLLERECVLKPGGAAGAPLGRPAPPMVDESPIMGLRMPMTPPRPSPPVRVVSDRERAEESWKNSNPSLNMMLYRTMIDGE